MLKDGIYFDRTTREFFFKDEKSIVPEGSLRTEDDAREYYLANQHFYDAIEGRIFSRLRNTLTIKKMKNYELQHILPSMRREWSYSNLRYRLDGTALIKLGNKALTIDEAVQQYLYYLAEDNLEKTNGIQELIVSGKSYIRGLYSDPEECNGIKEECPFHGCTVCRPR